MPFSGLSERLQAIRQRIAAAVARGGHDQQVQIVAVTKTHGVDAVRAAWDAGLTMVGENRIQEALPKMEEAGVPVEWHLIGHLQRNKAKHAARFALVHSMDSGRLAGALHEVGAERGSPVRVLAQVNISGEESKGGLSLETLPAEAERWRDMSGIEVVGVMTMAPLDAEERVLRTTFAGARSALSILKQAGHPAREISMGMSNDFEIAVEEGATMVRLGTILFGEREP